MNHFHLYYRGINDFAWDLIYWFVFSLGVLLFLIKRADLAKRSPLNGVKSKREYFSLNWVVLLYRFTFESVLLWGYRYPDLDPLKGLGIPGADKIHFPRMTQSLVLAFFGGLAASSLLDYILGRDKIFGIPIPSVVKEFIPQLPQVQELVSTISK
jgi:hypothetical protein